MKNILEVHNLSYSISEKKLFESTQTKTILEDVSFVLQKDKILGIAGESGSGKTTLAKLIANIIVPASGTINFNLTGDWSNAATSPIQILFQNNGDILNPLREVGSIIDEAIKIRFGKIEEAQRKKVLDSVNMPEKLWHRKGFELSGGEQQRAALARLLAVQPEVLILDEPFSAQDPASQLNFLQLFKSINQEYKISMICISHNLKILRAMCDEIIILYKGKLVESGATKDIFENPQHPYTKFLLKAEDYTLKYDEIQSEIELLKEE